MAADRSSQTPPSTEIQWAVAPMIACLVFGADQRSDVDDTRPGASYVLLSMTHLHTIKPYFKLLDEICQKVHKLIVHIERDIVRGREL